MAAMNIRPPLDERNYKTLWEDAMRRGDAIQANHINDYFHKRKAEIAMDEYANVFGTSAGQLGIANNSSASAISALANSALAQQYQNALMNQQIYGSSALTGINASIANGTIGASTYTAQSEPETAVEFGVLYMHGKELPADWAGAKITSYRRTASGTKWCVNFVSKWDKTLDIRVYFDMEEVNGKEVTAMAETYVETLNQRRAG